jgi:antitoxin MazE
MRTDLIRIGNSRGVRIPKSVIDQCGFGNTVDLRVEGDQVILARNRKPREGWREALQAAKHLIARDELLLERIPESEFENDEWTW